jgi:isopentenyldiphosphate isomerase
MKELLEIYDLNNNFLGTQERKSFYNEIEKEFENNGIINKKVKTVRLILLNSKGRVYLQKRSKFKKHNAGLFDKTIGGHVGMAQDFNLAIIKECSEELGFPLTVVPKKDFKQAIKNIDLRTIGIAKQIEIEQNFISTRINHKKIIQQPLINAFYIGYYDGPLQFFDGESSGVEVFSLEELEDELKKHPKKYTLDVKYIIKKHKNLIIPIK